MRPRALDEFVGQEHLVGERGPLRRSIARGHLSSLAAVGPAGHRQDDTSPACSPTRSAPSSTALSAVCRVSPRSAPRSPRPRNASLCNGQRTVLFIDEIHRFNKAQQDALLPHVEDGTVTLIGATTENPYFEVNSALLSRMRVWRLEALTDEEVATRRPPRARRRGTRPGGRSRARRRRSAYR